MTIQEVLSYAKRLVKSEAHVEFARAVIRMAEKKEKSAPHPCHIEAVAVYKAFLEAHQLPFKMDARGGKALKEILFALQKLSRSQSPEGALEGWQWMLKNWQVLNSYLQNRKELTKINDNLIEIYEKIKNGTSKTTPRRVDSEQRATERGALGKLASAILLQGGVTNGDGRVEN